MAQLTFGRVSRRICRDRRHRVDLSVAAREHRRQRCFVTNSLGQHRADPEGETPLNTHPSRSGPQTPALAKGCGQRSSDRSIDSLTGCLRP